MLYVESFQALGCNVKLNNVVKDCILFVVWVDSGPPRHVCLEAIYYLCVKLMPHNHGNLHYCAVCAHPLSNAILYSGSNQFSPFLLGNWRNGALWCCTSRGGLTETESSKTELLCEVFAVSLM
jgi:hypothetical protein